MRRILCISAVLMILLPSLVSAQGRVIRVIVPYAPGGTVDVIARIYAQKVEELLKERWLIENLSGGSGTIGSHVVAKAVPDGATLLFTVDAHSVAQLVIKNVPYDPLTDFVPIARVAEVTLVFVVNPAAIRARNLAELVSDIKADPKRFSFAIPGLGSTPHLAAEVFRSRVNADILIVPYRGTSPAINDVVSGQVNMMVVPPLVSMQLVRGGKLRALAVTASRRFEGAPEVPTTAEAGMPDFLFNASYGFWGPKGLPKDVVIRINAAMRQASEYPDLRRRLLDLGVSAIWETPEAFAANALADLQNNGRILQQAGVKPE
jgi:tripartite-type tricarboxylate transporter receptor subunit TctC